MSEDAKPPLLRIFRYEISFLRLDLVFRILQHRKWNICGDFEQALFRMFQPCSVQDMEISDAKPEVPIILKKVPFYSE